MSSAPSAKRSRTDTDDNNTNNTATAATINSTNNKDTNNNSSSIDNNNDVISTSKILQQITTLTNDYRNATPFPHGIISNFCTDGLLGELCMLYVSSLRLANLSTTHHQTFTMHYITNAIHIHILSSCTLLSYIT